MAIYWQQCNVTSSLVSLLMRIFKNYFLSFSLYIIGNCYRATVSAQCLTDWLFLWHRGWWRRACVFCVGFNRVNVCCSLGIFIVLWEYLNQLNVYFVILCIPPTCLKLDNFVFKQIFMDKQFGCTIYTGECT